MSRISPIVIKLERPDGSTVTYVEETGDYEKKTIRERQHKLRIKEVIYGGCFGYYRDEMDFSNLPNIGYKILIDNRK